jgi:hypothetical protein
MTVHLVSVHIHLHEVKFVSQTVYEVKPIHGLFDYSLKRRLGMPEIRDFSTEIATTRMTGLLVDNSWVRSDFRRLRGDDVLWHSQPVLFNNLGSRQVIADFSAGYLSSDGGYCFCVRSMRDWVSLGF